jgi:hypothetical protein
MNPCQGRWASPRRAWAFHHSSPATMIEGPGTAWVLVLFGTDSAAQSADSRVSTPAYLLCDLGHEFAGDGLNGRWGSRRASDISNPYFVWILIRPSSCPRGYRAHIEVATDHLVHSQYVWSRTSWQI